MTRASLIRFSQVQARSSGWRALTKGLPPRTDPLAGSSAKIFLFFCITKTESPRTAMRSTPSAMSIWPRCQSRRFPSGVIFRSTAAPSPLAAAT